MSEDKGKSVLDGVEVKNKAFSNDPDYAAPAMKVGMFECKCPHCGKAITITAGASPATLRSADIADLAQTK